MIKVNKLKNIMFKYLDLDEVDENSDTISLYTLVNIIDNKLLELRKAMNTDDFLNKLNYTQKNIFNRVLYTNISPRIDYTEDYEIKTSVVIVFKKGKREDSVVFCRKLNDDLLYSRGNVDILNDKSFDVCCEEFENMFNTLEEFALLFHNNKNNCFPYKLCTQKIDNDDFDIEINYDTVGHFYYRINIKDNYVSDKDKKRYSDIIKNFKKDILKKIPVKVNELDPMFQTIIKNNMTNKEKSITY